MHALILTALLTGATAFGVTGYNNAQPKAINNNNEISQVQRAYYDPETTYDTTTNRFYNYTSAIFNPDGDSSFSIQIGEYGRAEIVEGDPKNAFGAWDSQGDMGSQYFKLDEGQYTQPVDFYAGGTFIATIYPLSNGSYELPEVPESLNESYPAMTKYSGWLFDHEEPKLENKLFDVVGDTITAFAGTIGVGFTSMISIFYNEGITPLGILALITLGVALVWFAWNLVSNLLRQRH